MLSYSLVKASVKGDKPINQDAVLMYEDADYVIMSLADGLGEAIHSDVGAKEICKSVLSVIKRSIKVSGQLSLSSILAEWASRLNKKGYSAKDCRTTNSFVIVNKIEQQVFAAVVGDSMISVECDGQLNVLMPEKDFANITECIGGDAPSRYKLSKYKFKQSLRVLIASDGICDELEITSLQPMIEYLIGKYQNIVHKRRNQLLAGEIRRTFSRLNVDDKSMILLWNHKIIKSDECSV